VLTLLFKKSGEYCSFSAVNFFLQKRLQAACLLLRRCRLVFKLYLQPSLQPFFRSIYNALSTFGLKLKFVV